MIITEVRFGAVFGVKAVTVNWRFPEEKLCLSYDLEAPGGYICVMVGSNNTSVDELEIEKYFHTLHVVDKRPD